MASSSQNRIQKFKGKPKHSERFGDKSKIHNKRGNGRQKHLNEADDKVDLHDYFF